MSAFDRLPLSVPDILLPAEGVDLPRWAVVACDQFTSEPEYWEEVRLFVGPAPSTLNLIFPEAFLGKPGEEERIASIRAAMRDTLARGLLRAGRGFVFIERQTGARTRRGLLACLDLEAYDYTPGSASLIRATEGTILERIPPRVKIREGAPLELPHIMVLFDDPADTVIGPLAEARDRLEKLYDFELMMDSGRLAGYRIGAGAIEDGVMRALESLADPEAFRLRYGVPKEKPVLLFAMGDGNHSLATAKAIWEKTKRNDPQGAVRSPLRHALVELVNLHDPALVFEPIHRVVFGVRHDPVEEWKRSESGEGVVFHPVAGLEEMRRRVDAGIGRSHKIGVVRPEGFGVLEVGEPIAQMPVGSLQGFLDRFLEQGGAREADYVHGAEIVSQLGRRPGNAGFYLPAMAKDDLFRTIILDGVLPRKTFSMGEAKEKRFYMEARLLKEPHQRAESRREDRG